jgi:hypothetical protein
MNKRIKALIERRLHGVPLPEGVTRYAPGKNPRGHHRHMHFEGEQTALLRRLARRVWSDLTVLKQQGQPCNELDLHTALRLSTLLKESDAFKSLVLPAGDSLLDRRIRRLLRKDAKKRYKKEEFRIVKNSDMVYLLDLIHKYKPAVTSDELIQGDWREMLINLVLMLRMHPQFEDSLRHRLPEDWMTPWGRDVIREVFHREKKLSKEGKLVKRKSKIKTGLEGMRAADYWTFRRILKKIIARSGSPDIDRLTAIYQKTKRTFTHSDLQVVVGAMNQYQELFYADFLVSVLIILKEFGGSRELETRTWNRPRDWSSRKIAKLVDSLDVRPLDNIADLVS